MITSQPQSSPLFCANCHVTGHAKWLVRASANFSEITLEGLAPGFRFITCHGALLAKIECMKCSARVLSIGDERLKRTG
jgi:hypothetical protein